MNENEKKAADSILIKIVSANNTEVAGLAMAYQSLMSGVTTRVNAENAAKDRTQSSCSSH